MGRKDEERVPVLDDADLTPLVEQFRELVRAKDPMSVVRQVVTHGSAVMVTDEKYVSLKEAVADALGVNANQNVFMVGSAKLGFSIKKKCRYESFSELSDIDIAVVTPTTYEQLWLEARRLNRPEILWSSDDRNHFRNDHFKGVIKPYLLPDESNLKRKFFDMEVDLKLASGNPFDITLAVWHDMSALENYQATAVGECKEEMQA